MKYFHAFLTLPSVASSLIVLDKGEVLFEQGEAADSAFLLLDGKMRLTGEGDDWVYNEPSMGPGEVIGEKALVHEGSYQRRFGVEAVARCQLLEVSRKTFLLWQKECPSLMSEVVFFMVAGFLRRQDSANFLIGALRPIDPLRRVVSVLSYWSRTQFGTPKSESVPTEFPLAMLYHYLDIDRERLVAILSHLASLDVLEFKGKDSFALKNRERLMAVLTTFDKKAA